jgi:hypothetical protein
MATPTGQISFGDLSVEILQAGSTSQRNMNDAAVRLGYGSTSQVSISNLKKAWGCTITEGQQTDKFGTQYGFDQYLFTYGSSDDTSITGSTVLQYAKFISGANTITGFFIPGTPTYETGFRATDVGRLAYGGTNITGFASFNGDGSSTPDQVEIAAGYFDGSGTTTIGIKWN